MGGLAHKLYTRMEASGFTDLNQLHLIQMLPDLSVLVKTN